jgi:EAL domain-containing protein (putative c-di-GMP-specific phosphodiesterase class I)
LEITESAIMVDPLHAMEILSRLSGLGGQLSIDDFGTGYSSLGYLKRLPVHEIKIDKSFVMDMGKSEDDTVLVLSIINLAHNLGLKVVAEGVENQLIRDQLTAFDCDAGQGYFWSKPLPSTDLVRWLGESPWSLGKKPGSVLP